MADIEFSVATARPVAEVKSTIDAEIAARLPGGRIKRFWEGDVFRLVGMGADGHIEVRPGEVRVSVVLKAPLSFMKGKVEQGLRETVEKAAGGDGRPAPERPGSLASTLPDEGLPPEEVDGLRARLDGVVLPGPQAHDEFLTNFGHLHHWRPRLVVKPASPDDVLATLAHARRHGLTVSTRGAAHSQSELAINRDGILLDMKSMDRILEVDEASRTATVEAGAVWRDVVARTWRHGLIPPVLTNNLSVTVGGTLSVAGIGVASFRHGAQTDNVEELEVATVDGAVHRCSRSERPELFWGVLSGLGQVAIILRAKLRLRRAKPMTRSYYLLYDDHRRFLEDARAAMDSGRWDYLESWCAPCPQGLKWVGGVRQPFAKWMFPFHLTAEFETGREPDAARLLEGLRPYANLHVDDLPTHEFANRLVPVFDVWRKLGTWEHLHPWMEVVMPYSTVAEFLDAILPDLSPGVNVGGHVLLWPARSSVSEVKLFMHPQEEYLVGFGILPAVPPKLWDQVRPRLQAASDLSIAMGGKRYLSGYVAFDAAEWREHFGPRWAELERLKKEWDPEGRLNPGFVRYA
ncbi:MAG TPA: polyhydroxyalkanoic acid system family protein [Vicinamibacteria bacterium]|nr:polyhydroxyalkanoic acid system family protein [Vicinamibacteria bacterium]